MYNNYIFDLYGTLIDINTDEWNDDLWKKIAILYAYKGAHYTYDELNEEYDRLVQAEKEAVLKKSPDTKVVDIKIEKVFRKLFTQKGVKFDYYDSKDGGHSWPVWREDLYLFAQKLFK